MFVYVREKCYLCKRLKNKAMTIETLNILSIIISIRLQSVGGSDKVCV